MAPTTTLPFCFPAVSRKKITAAFDGGRLTSDGGVLLLALAERRLGIAQRLARLVITHAPDSGAQALMVVRMVPKTVVPDVRRAVSTTVRTAASPSAAHIAR